MEWIDVNIKFSLHLLSIYLKYLGQKIGQLPFRQVCLIESVQACVITDFDVSDQI